MTFTKYQFNSESSDAKVIAWLKAIVEKQLIDKIKASMKTNNLFFLILNPPFHKLY